MKTKLIFRAIMVIFASFTYIMALYSWTYCCNTDTQYNNSSYTDITN